MNKPTVADFEGIRPPTVTEFEPPDPQRISVWEPTLKERIRNTIRGIAQRSPFVQQGKRLGQLGLHHLSEAVSGIGLYIPDILASKITQEDTLASAVDKITGFEPTPRDVGAGEAAKFVTSLHTVGRVLGPAIAAIPARPALQIILGSGVSFGGRKATEELAKKISTGKPIDVEGIHFDSGIGVLFGAGQVGVSKFVNFVKNFRFLPKAQIRPARAEVNAALKHYQKTGDRTRWDAVRIKYAGIKPEVISRIRARVSPPEVREFGKYPIARPIEKPPTVGKLAPRRPVAPITKPEARIPAKPVAKKWMPPIDAVADKYTDSKEEYLALRSLIQGMSGAPATDIKLIQEGLEGSYKRRAKRALSKKQKQRFKHLVKSTDFILDVSDALQERNRIHDLSTEEALGGAPLHKGWSGIASKEITEQAKPVISREVPTVAKAEAERTADTMAEAIALSSPSGKISKRAKDAAMKRLGKALFGEKGLQPPTVKQPTEAERLKRQAKELRGLAEQGMSTKKFLKQAKELEEKAAKLEAQPVAKAEPTKKITVPKDISQRAQKALSILNEKGFLGHLNYEPVSKKWRAFLTDEGAIKLDVAPDKDWIRTHKEFIGTDKITEVEKWAQEALKKAEPTKIEKKPKGKLDVTPLLKVHQTFMRVLEPAKAVERIVGKEPYATVIKGVHQTDVGRIEFTEAQLVGHDKSIGKLGEWFNRFSDKDLRNLMLSRGQPTTIEAELIQQNAINNLPKELRGKRVRNAIEQIANFNYAYLQKVAGDDINKVADYFYGIYKDPQKVDRFLDYWRTTKRFTKEKKLPTVADAVDYGLELRNYNPIENLKAEYLAIAHLEGMTWMRNELLRTGKGKYVDETLASPIEWEKVNDPVFRDLRLQPDLAHLINNLIATNKLTKVPTLNALRQINNNLRTIKFIGSAFHLLSVAKQSMADSGYLGFLYKPTALRGITRGFRANDPIFRTTAYKDYIRHGGGHRYSVESEAMRAFNMAIDELNRNMGRAIKAGALPLKIPTGFVNWMFQNYIPKVKYSKFLDVVAEQEKKLNRKLTSPEKIDIIKEQQNFYGMMNERLFGRSGTVTTAMRFYFMSPGYAEGNYRTMLKAATQWGGKGGFKANRSRSNIINSWLISGITATVGTLAFTGKLPKKPENLEAARDLFKIDTGKTDEKGRKIMIDLMTYDKDYWNVAFNILRLRPDVAVGKSWKRIGGMKAPTAIIIHDLTGMMMGKAIMDWKNDRIYHITDPFLQKVMKLTLYEVKRLKPISVSVYEQSRKRDIDKTVAAVETLLGFRPTKTEKENREQKIINKMYSLVGQREEMSYYIGQSTDPKRTVARYNKTVNDILKSPYVPKSMKDEWGPKLLVDYENVVTWKRFPAGKMTGAELQRAYDAHTLSVPYKRRGEPFRPIGEPKKGSERRVSELKAEAQKRGIELKRSPRKPPRR